MYAIRSYYVQIYRSSCSGYQGYVHNQKETQPVFRTDPLFVITSYSIHYTKLYENLSYEVQVQLLRALQERRVRPVGSNEEIPVDIRLVAATNENLEEAIEKGNFREDLFHRINEFMLPIPELKERKEDILFFANFFRNNFV